MAPHHVVMSKEEENTFTTELKIGSLYRCKVGETSLWSKYLEYGQPSDERRYVGVLKTSDVFQLIAIRKMHQAVYVKVLSGMSLGWFSAHIDFVTTNAWKQLFEELTPERHE